MDMHRGKQEGEEDANIGIDESHSNPRTDLIYRSRSISLPVLVRDHYSLIGQVITRQ